MNETVIAVGNGGYNLATDLIAAGLFTDAQLIVCDTNQKDLEKNSANVTETFILEKLRSKVKSGDTPLVEAIVAKASDAVIVCATLGGMTGSKYAPLIALEAILKGKFVCSFFSMPYEFEGEQKTKRAMNARMKLIVSSYFAVQQNNDRLKEVVSLGLNDIDKPLVGTIKSAMSHKSLVELADTKNNDSLQAYIPEEYRVNDMPLVWIRSNIYHGISDDERKNIFNLY
jgi:tubulin/ftsZ family, GTPase domain